MPPSNMTIEQFKSNLNVVEKELQINAGDYLIQSIKVANSWVEFVQSDGSKEELSFVLREFLPSITRVLLSRRYDLSYKDACNITAILERAIVLITKYIGVDDTATRLAEMLLNPWHPLYLKLALFEKIDPATVFDNSGPKEKLNQTFIDSLDTNSCIDCLNSYNIWELAAIEQFSSFRTEFEVSFENGQRVWLSVESDASKYAPFGTKTGLISAAPDISNNEKPANALTGQPLTEIPEVGSLIDAKCSFGAWFQACVLETKLVEETSAMVVFSEPSNELPKAENIHSEVPISSENEGTKRLIVFLRVAFIGLAESFDEWISLDSDRLAVLNTASGQKRGDLRVRDEILFLSWKGPERSSLDDSFTAYTEQSFTSVAYAKIVELFGRNFGFERIFQFAKFYLDSEKSDASTIIPIFHLIKVLAMPWRVLSDQFHKHIMTHFLPLALNVVTSMSYNEIRVVSAEELEGVFTSVELLSNMAARNKNVLDARVIEFAKLQMSLKYLESSILNRRLGGLKILTDLLNRAFNAKRSPDGIERQETGANIIKYSVIPITHALSIRDICEELHTRNILVCLYTGVDIHESLIDRSGIVLRAFAEEDILETRQILDLFQLASDSKNASILKIFTEFVPCLVLSKMHDLLIYFESLEKTRVSSAVVDIVNSIAVKCRHSVITSFDTSSDSVLNTHSTALSILWTWLRESEDQDPALCGLCVQKLEALAELGVSHKQAIENSSFPWYMQWRRYRNILESAISAIANNEVITPSYKIIQSFIYSWPTQTPKVSSLSFGTDALPFDPVRYAAVEHLIQAFAINSIIENSIRYLKQSFQELVQSNPTAVNGRSKLHGSSISYTDQMEIIADVIYLIIRSSNQRIFPIKVIEIFWESLALNAFIVEEFDIAFTFMGKVVNKMSDVPNSASEVQAAAPEAAQQASQQHAAQQPPQEEGQRLFAMLKSEIMYLYKSLICDGRRGQYFSSPFFTARTFRCVEKWFKWINEELRFMKESKDKRAIESIDCDPTALEGVDILLQICFDCVDDSVAVLCTRLISSIIRAASSSGVYRELLLEQCMTLISSDKATLDRLKAKRSLVILEGLIEESFLSSDRKLFSHAYTSTGSNVTFKVASTSKNLKNLGGDIILRMNDSVEDLFTAVSRLMKVSTAEIKLFRLGKELSLSDSRKIISQLPNISEKESLMVAERPHSKMDMVPSASASGSAACSATDEPQSESLPSKLTERNKSTPIALKISTDFERFKIFLELLSNSDDVDLINNLWKIITQLPTSWDIFNSWRRLDCVNVQELVQFSFTADSSHKLGELVYILQVVEIFLDPMVSVRDLSVQFSNESDAHAYTDTAVSTWWSSFVEKGGLQFLYNAFHWISFISASYCNGFSKAKGINMTMILLGSRISGKLLRAFLIKAFSVSDRVEYKECIGSFIEKYGALPTPQSQLKSLDDAAAAVNSSTEAIHEVVQRGEWGRNITPSPEMSDHIITAFNKKEMFWFAMLRLLTLCQIEKSYAFSKTSPDSFGKSLESQERSLLTTALQDLLFIAVSIAISNSALLSEYELDMQSHSLGFHSVIRIGYEELLRVALVHTGHQQTAKASGNSLLFEWFPTAFSDLLRWITIRQKDESLVQGYLSHMIEIILNIRPAVQLQNGSDNSEDEQYFKFASIMLLYSHKLGIRSQSVTVTVQAIIQEIRLIIDLSNGSENNKSRNCNNMTGNMRLLANIVKHDERACFFIDQATFDMFVHRVVGLLEANDSTLLPIALTSESKRYIYDMLLSACLNDPDIAAKAMKRIRLVQESMLPPTTWDTSPEKMSRSVLGFSGLRNLGSTCYMNSLLQILFTNNSIRENVSNSIRFDGLYSEEGLKNNVAFQLQSMFIHLSNSEKKYFSPLDWTFAYKDEFGVNPVDVLQQQDAIEFLQQFCDRYESSIAAHRKRMQDADPSIPLSSLPEDILRLTFGGKISNQMYCEPVHGQSVIDSIQEHGIREQQENFVCLSVNVENCANLVESLKQFVEGETISDFSWEEGKPRRTIVKRQCIAELSDTVIFHLKRFKLDYNTFHREKVNDSFPFPLHLDMKPFSKEGLEEIDHKERASAVVAGKSDGADDSESTRDNAYYDYELAGVVVHTGTSDSGHYFSYVKDPHSASPDDWVEFNDAEVHRFSPSQLEYECFGGTTSVTDLEIATGLTKVHQVVNSKNAYILVYNRVSKLRSAAAAPLQHPLPRSALVEKIKQEISLENAQHRLSCRLLEKEYLQFYANLLSVVLTRLDEGYELLDCPDAIVLPAFRFLFHYLAKTPHVEEQKTLSSLLVRWVEGHGRKAAANLPVPVQKNDKKVAILPLAEALSQSSMLLPPAPPSREEESSSANALLPPPPPLPAAQLTTPFTAALPLSKQVLSDLLINKDAVVDALISPPKAETRDEIALVYFKLIESSWEEESPRLDVFDFTVLKYGAISALPSAATHSSSKANDAGAMEIDDMDADLALAIKLSQETTSATTVAATAEATAASVSVDPTEFIESACIRAVLELTADKNMALISEHWRKSVAYCRLLKSLSTIGRGPRQLLLQRDMISQCIDLILGDQSPLCGQLYAFNSRKRAPSSYVSVGVMRDSTVPYAARSIPDWGDLLDLLVILISDCDIQPVSLDNDNAGSFLSHSFGALSEWDRICLTSKTLYSTLIKQARYREPMTRLIEYFSRESRKFSEMIIEVVWEEMTVCAAENIVFIFELLERFLSIEDQFMMPRCYTLFGRGQQSLVDLFHSFQSQPLKANAIVVFVRSFAALLVRVPILGKAMNFAKENVNNFASWSIPFCIQFKQTALGGSGSNSSAAVPTVGPYILVYGESLLEVEIAWHERATRALHALGGLLIGWGIDPSQYVPPELTVPTAVTVPTTAVTVAAAAAADDAVVQGPHLPSSASAGAGIETSTPSKSLPTDKKVFELHDGMSDEELARLLESDAFPLD